MPTPYWKEFERKLAKWIDGRRYPSQGMSHVDVANDIISIESKYRDSKSIPAWIRQAFDQMRENKRRDPDKHSVIMLGEHFGRGIPTNVYIIMQVDIKTDLFVEALDNLLEAKAQVEAKIAEITAAMGKDDVA